MYNINNFYSSYYDNILEIDELKKVQQFLADLLYSEATKLEANQYIITADYEGIIEYEKILQIIPDPSTESLEFRRERVLNRWTLQPPFTMVFLRQRLDSIVGAGNYDAYVDYENYTLYVEMALENVQWYNELYITIGMIKPANIVYIYKPRITNKIKLNETISLQQVQWNYKLNGSWKLGEKPFQSASNIGVIKMPSTTSITPLFLNMLATSGTGFIQGVLLNNTVNITTFDVKTTEDNKIHVEYTVTPEMVSTINSISLLTSGNQKLTIGSVYQPVSEIIRIKHLIPIEEGV